MRTAAEGLARRLVSLASSVSTAVRWVFGERSAQALYKLGTGSKIKVTVFGDLAASKEYEVDASGAISVHHLGRIQTQGFTVAEIEQTLIDRYKNCGYYRNPRIKIELINLRPFYILGEVEQRGLYPYIGGLKVARAVALANGYTCRASRSRITIQRVGGKEEPATEDTPLYPGDIVRVPAKVF
jgi:protein involved in polysaccharide export with SLBB domain